MKLTKTQYKKLDELMPITMKLLKISIYEFMCTMLYVIDNCRKWMALPKKDGIAKEICKVVHSLYKI